MMKSWRGFTLIELLIAIAVVAVIVTLAAPSFADFILMQRLKSISAQSMTDMQFARTEATSRNVPVRVRFGADPSRTCYVLYTGAAGDCNCTRNPVCPTLEQNIRTVEVDRSLRVTVTAPVVEFTYDPGTRTILLPEKDTEVDSAQGFVFDVAIDEPRTLRTSVKLSGRPGVCAPPRSTMSVEPCPE